MLDTCLYVSAAGFYILLLSFISTEFSQTALASYNISSGKFKWLDAGEECIPATPDITAATHSPTVYTVEDLGIDIQENENIWVGYYQAWRVFEYIGCVSQSYYSTIQPDYVEIKGDPGQCFPKCTDSSVVGVTKTRCYCLGDSLDTNADTLLTECRQECDYPQVACGFYTNAKSSYWSIYKINSNVDHIKITNWLSEEPGDKNCLCVDRTNLKKYYWQTCTAALLVMCTDGTDIKEKNSYLTWIYAANFCFGQNYFPTDMSSSAWVQKGEGSQLWTGCFKTLVTFKHDAKISVNRRHDKKWYGYLYKDELNQLKVGFMDNTTEKRVLCGNGKSDRAKKLTTQATRSTTTASSQSNLSNKGTGSETSTTTPQSSTSTIGTSTNGIYIALGASAAGVVFIATITALTIVFLKRRRNVKHRSGSLDDTATNQRNENDDTAKTSNNYFILKPHEKEGEHENVTYDTTDDNATNDTTEAGQEYERVKTENVYNQLDIGTEQTYDLTITHKTNKSVKANKVTIDDTYDFASAENKAKANVHTDNIYDKTENMDDNVYNQLGDKCIQNVTDNVYGIQGQNV